MKKLLAFLIVPLAFTVNGIAAESGPDIRIVDNKVSIQAEAIPLSRLLRLLDQVTGMTSKVPPELANRNVSVRFTDLTLEDAVHKIFEGQPFDYVVIGGKGIIVTGTSQAVTARNLAPIASPPPENIAEENPAFLPPQMQQQQQPIPGIVNGMPNGINGAAQNQPAMIQTPFGQIPNPRAQQGQQGTTPMVIPGQTQAQNPFSGSLPGFNSSSQLPTLQSNPSFGSPTPTQPVNSPFNTAPFGTPSTPPQNIYPGQPSLPFPPRPNP